MTTFDFEKQIISSQINSDPPNFSITLSIGSQKGLEVTKNSCTDVLKLFQDAKHDRDLFDKGLKIVNVGKNILDEIQKTVDQYPNSNFKVYIEESSTLQKLSECLSNIKAFVDQ